MCVRVDANNKRWKKPERPLTMFTRLSHLNGEHGDRIYLLYVIVFIENLNRNYVFVTVAVVVFTTIDIIKNITHRHKASTIY